MNAVQTSNVRLGDWVREVAALSAPADVVWCTGSLDEWARLTDQLVAAGTLVRLNQDKKPNSFWCASDPQDVARVEDRTFICSKDAAEAGPTNNWADPDEMTHTLTERFRGSMRGRTMYVIPFCMGPIGASGSRLGVQLTDSAYVAASMRIMTRMGAEALAQIEAGADWVRCLHSVGAPLEPGAADVPWPCNPTKYIAHFPQERAIWSFGSGYGGNALLGKKCYALRIASVMARDEGWLAEHMLILKLTSPTGAVHYVAGAFPSACGKTNLAMLRPTLPGWQVQTIGDDIAWMRFGADGRLYAVNPEAGFFGVAPGTGHRTNPNAMATIERGNSIFTNVALTDDGDVWWEGMTQTPPAHVTSWRGADWRPGAPEPAAHPNSRFCTPAGQCPTMAPEWSDPAGVPISAIFLGGRRGTTVPLVTEARSWQHGVFLGATLSSQTTAAAAGRVGVVRRDPFAMLPFLGYHVGDYVEHWLQIGRRADPERLPRFFYVNWFRQDADGAYLWPGFGDNSRVLAWALGRLEGTAAAVDTPVGLVPAPGALDLTGLELADSALPAALRVDPAEWAAELPLIEQWLDTFGERCPAELRQELAELTDRVTAAG